MDGLHQEKAPIAINDFDHAQQRPLAMQDLQASKTSSNDDPKLEHLETSMTTYDASLPVELYRDGQLIYVPAKTRDPRDPLNLPLWHKVLGLGCLSFFGALIASAELILGAALPVFAIEYSGLFSVQYYYGVQLEQQGGFPAGVDPLVLLNSFLAAAPGAPHIFDIYLLATIPVLMIGVSNLFLVPLAIAIGRRPVIIALGCVAIAAASWAGGSTSLGSHIGARAVQAMGAGSVESLIPFIIQDITHVHERNTWISAAFACQGVIIIAIGFSAPYIIINLSWRWLYWITASIASLFLVGVILFLPETRWSRTRSEMNGIPRNDTGVEYRPRTIWYDLMPFRGGFYPMKGVVAFWDTMRTFFYPSILFVTLLNGSVIASAFAAGFTTAPALLVNPWAWPFKHLGLCLIPVLVAAILVGIVTGGVADYFANAMAKARGSRLPENQLINLVLPWICSWLGALLFGLAGQSQEKYPWIMFLLALGFMCFGFLGTSTITTVYVLESYPHIAGPALVNVASFRWIMAFLLTLWSADWITNLGYKRTFLIYTGLIIGFGLFIPVVYWFGPAWRKRFPATRMNRNTNS